MKIENLKPRAGSAYKYSWHILWDKFISFFLVMLIIMVASLPLKMVGPFPLNINSNFPAHFEDLGSLSKLYLEHVNPTTLFISVAMGVFGMIYYLFVLNPIKFGALWVYLKAIRQQPFDVKETFDVFKNYLNVVLAALLMSAIIIIGFAFLIIPGIIFACRLAFVPMLVMDKKLDPVKAVEESWRLTKGYGWKVFWFGLLAIPICLLGLICLGIGVIISGMWISAALVALYHAVQVAKGEVLKENTVQ
jgi:uncharacterized membrane protein